MPRTRWTEETQIAIETTPGTPETTGFRTLPTLSITPGITITGRRVIETYGQRWPNRLIGGWEMVNFGYEGGETYEEIVHIFASLFGLPTVTEIATATGSYLWTWNPGNAVYTPKTYTIEQGGGGRNHRFAYGLFTGISMDLTPDEFTISGDGVGQRLVDGATLGTLGGAINLEPIDARDFTVYLDEAAAGIGVTKLAEHYHAAINFSDIYGVRRVIDKSLTSFKGHVDRRNMATLQLESEANAQGMAWIEDLRANDRVYCRIQAIGQNRSAGAAANADDRLTIDMCLEVLEGGDFGDADDVLTSGPTFQIVRDSAWNSGQAMSITVVNRTAALL